MKKIVPTIVDVISNRRLDKAGLYYSIRLRGFNPVTRIMAGQFVHVKTAAGLDPYFRRAFSITDFDAEKRELEIIYKIIGRGTARLGVLKKGDNLDIIGPLGNGFSKIAKTKIAIIVAGGVGFPPLYFLAKQMVANGHLPEKIMFFYGGRTRDDLIEISRIKKLGVKFYPCTDDGTFGYKGFVTQLLADELLNIDTKKVHAFGCGPEPMLAAFQKIALERNINGEVSLEAPMPCGVGVCLGCIKERLDHPGKYIRVCYEGPVFKIGEVKL